MKKHMKIILSIIVTTMVLLAADLIYIYANNRPLLAIKAKEPYMYKGIFYNTYNCPEYSTPQIKAKGTKFSCAVLNIIEENESKYKVTELENVSISISDITLTGATIIIKDTNKNPYTYGEWYVVEKQINGKWYEVKTKVEDRFVDLVGYVPDKNNEVKFTIDWEWLYGELPLGSYRILKQANNEYISIQFGIATTS